MAKNMSLILLKLLSLFPSRFGTQLDGSAGIITTIRPCGCVIKAEHIPEKALWIFTCDYSNCKNAKHYPKSKRSRKN